MSYLTGGFLYRGVSSLCRLQISSKSSITRIWDAQQFSTQIRGQLYPRQRHDTIISRLTTVESQLQSQIQRRTFKIPFSQKKNEWEEMSKLSISQRLRVMIKKYWYVAIPLHCVNCCIWLSALYLVCRLGFDGSKLIAIIQPHVMKSQLVPEFIKSYFQKDPSSLGHVAVAVLLYKLLTPARYATTVFASFYTIKFLLRSGILVRTADQQFKAFSFLSQANAKNLQKRIEKLRKKARSKPRQ